VILRSSVKSAVFSVILFFGSLANAQASICSWIWNPQSLWSEEIYRSSLERFRQSTEAIPQFALVEENAAYVTSVLERLPHRRTLALTFENSVKDFVPLLRRGLHDPKLFRKIDQVIQTESWALNAKKRRLFLEDEFYFTKVLLDRGLTYPKSGRFEDFKSTLLPILSVFGYLPEVKLAERVRGTMPVESRYSRSINTRLDQNRLRLSATRRWLNRMIVSVTLATTLAQAAQESIQQHVQMEVGAEQVIQELEQQVLKDQVRVDLGERLTPSQRIIWRQLLFAIEEGSPASLPAQLSSEDRGIIGAALKDYFLGVYTGSPDLVRYLDRVRDLHF
jgi:hypothetical protein